MQSELITEIQSKAFFNYPYAFSSICLIYPLTIGQIMGSVGMLNYSSYLSILTMDEFDIAENAKRKGITIDPTTINTFHFIIDSAKQNYSFLLEVKNAFRTFVGEEITILFDEYIIVIGDLEEKRFITSENFGDFQNIVRVQNKKTVKEDPPPDESPIRRKFRLKAEYRDAVKRNQKSNDPNAPDFLALISSFCCYKDGITPEELKNYSFFAFKEEFERHQLREKYSIDVKSILAGADPKKVKPEPWIKKISN